MQSLNYERCSKNNKIYILLTNIFRRYKKKVLTKVKSMFALKFDIIFSELIIEGKQLKHQTITRYKAITDVWGCIYNFASDKPDLRIVEQYNR